ncbi:uncharacterized protein LOC116286399 [Actinia tenebrosa]|uniref:Uncharacterized protein LOC116286399 n=1 Tax=Actinia tenebrosa TaxID=6105 RepID=A0A6P8H7S0_ACTTE|nr:uncharacterized protein LOC116286399 [Actinia tenebrosa]
MMKEKLSLLIALLLAMTSVVSAASQEILHTLAICFIVFCIILLIIAMILPIILYRRLKQQRTKGYIGSAKGSRYDLSGRERKVSEAKGKDPVSFYGIYNDPQPADSIYLPLDKRTQEDGNYAHLEGSKTQEDPHAYEELKKNNNTFVAAVYDNPTATDNDDHDYEIADATIVRPKSKDYDNPPCQSDTAL